MALIHSLLLFFSLGTSSALASSFYEAPFPDTVRETPNIVRGKIGKSEVQWVNLPDGTRRLFTFYDVEVTEGFKGSAKGGTIKMRELGGEKEGVTLQISGTAQFNTGEDVVVMLGDSVSGSENVYPLSGMMMGKYTLEKGADGKEYLRGSGLGSTVNPALRKEANPALQVTLENLREIIKTQAAEPPKPKPDPSVKSAQEPLLSAKSGRNAVSDEKLENDVPAKPKKSSVPFRPIVLLVGVLGGAYWYLKTKKKRG